MNLWHEFTVKVGSRLQNECFASTTMIYFASGAIHRKVCSFLFQTWKSLCVFPISFLEILSTSVWNCRKKTSSNVAWLMCGSAREHPATWHDVCAEVQENIKQRGMTYVLKCKRTSSNVAWRMCGSARETNLLAVAVNFNIPPHPQNINMRMASYWRWHQKRPLKPGISTNQNHFMGYIIPFMTIYR